MIIPGYTFSENITIPIKLKFQRQLLYFKSLNYDWVFIFIHFEMGIANEDIVLLTG